LSIVLRTGKTGERGKSLSSAWSRNRRENSDAKSDAAKNITFKNKEKKHKFYFYVPQLF